MATEVLDAARQAPSAGNLQSWGVVVVEDHGLRQGLAEACLGQVHVGEAPVDLVFTADRSRSATRYGRRGRDLYAIQDATIAASFATLAAHDLGLGTCWVGALDEAEVEKLLDVPEDHRVVAVLALGRPADSGSETSRRPLESFIHRDGW